MPCKETTNVFAGLNLYIRFRRRNSMSRCELREGSTLTVFGARGHVEVHPLSAGADEAHEKLLDGVGVVGGEGGPVGGVHPQLACPLPALQSSQ